MKPKASTPTTIPKQRYTDELSNVDHVVTSVKPSHSEAPLYILEDDEAVIKMIIKGRGPTVRNVSRTHRVALIGSYTQKNKYVDTKNNSRTC